MVSNQTIEDPLTKGTGRIDSTMPYIAENDQDDDGYAMFIEFTLSGIENVFYKKIKASPIRLQNMPLILNLTDGKFFIKILRVVSFERYEEVDTIRIRCRFKLLDNLEYVSAIQEQRIYWDDHVKKS